MKDIEALLPRVLRYAPACPEVLAISHLRDAAQAKTSCARRRDPSSWKSPRRGSRV
jgi:hypothetical protein